MRQFFSPLFLIGIQALRDPTLKIQELKCSEQIDSLCASQCTANNCYSAQNIRDLNKCLLALHPGCTIEVQSELVVTLQQDVDFCDRPTDGLLPDGWLLNIPYMGNWEEMKNPTLALPVGTASSMGREACMDLMREITYRQSPRIATIDRNICVNSVQSDPHPPVRTSRFIDLPGNVFPIAVPEGVNSMLISPTLRSCWSPNIRYIDFSIEFKERLAGQSQLDLTKIVFSGTIPSNQFGPIIESPAARLPLLITSAAPERNMNQASIADEPPSADDIIDEDVSIADETPIATSMIFEDEVQRSDENRR